MVPISLIVDGLSAGYGKSTVVRSVSFEVGQDELVVLLGANGAGKTTTLMAVQGLLSAVGGSVSFNGYDVTRASVLERVKGGIALVPEGRQIFPRLTLADHLDIAWRVAHPRGASSEFEALEERVLELFPDLRSKWHDRAGSLSGGQQQMLAIGRGLATSPSLLILDEPSLGLSPLMVDAVMSALVALKSEGLSVLMVEQNVRRALDICDRAYVMQRGLIVASGRPDELAENSEVLHAAFLGTMS